AFFHHSVRDFAQLAQAMTTDALPRRAFLGVTVGRDLRVEAVLHGGAALAAGVRVGDVLLAIDGATVSNASQLARALRAGKPFTLRIARAGATIERAAVAPPFPTEPGVLLGQVISRGARLRTFFALPAGEARR